MRITATERSMEGGCPASLDGPITLEEGQVWELNVSDRLEPCVLLFKYEAREETCVRATYWRCLALESGVVFSATLRRWDPTYYANRAIDDPDDVPLVGRRLL